MQFIYRIKTTLENMYFVFESINFCHNTLYLPDRDLNTGSYVNNLREKILAWTRDRTRVSSSNHRPDKIFLFNYQVDSNVYHIVFKICFYL